jgi:Glycoside hydrolase family 5 C-terminal domain/Cellulase (glycosyl hydrolase family 5)
MIRIEGERFMDEAGRTLLLRGVNLGGSSKVPVYPDGMHSLNHFFQHRAVSFVGRPFPLEEADSHFSRLRSWGLTFLRLVVTWEAIEHAGPGLYDHDYLDYVVALVGKAAEYDIHLFIDSHQDVWSRFTGGDGAPGWTLEAVGMKLEALHAAGAAFVHQIHGDPFPRMIWPTNGSKLAAATMFTLFFAGNDFAPQTHIDGEPIQEYLQRHYCDAFAQLAQRLRDCPNAVGYDTLNEPLHGYIGVEDLNQLDGFVHIGASPTPYQGMLLGAGYPQEVECWKISTVGPRRIGKQVVNEKRVRIWHEDAKDIWLQHGVWEPGTNGQPRLLRPAYFAQVRGRRVNFSQDYYRPFANRFTHAMRAAHPGAVMFIETEVGHTPPRWSGDDANDIVYAPHWYDGLTLMMKHYTHWLVADTHTYRVVFGPQAAQRSIAAQLRHFQKLAREYLGNAPVLIGETGIPFDLDEGKAYRTGNFQAQSAAANRVFRGIEDSLSHCTWWNYTADNDHQGGDQWNGEDLSIFSRDQQHNLEKSNSGGRALDAIVRPYPRAVAGALLSLRFDPHRGTFSFTFRHDPQVTAATEIFIPNLQYPHGYQVKVSDGSFEQYPDRHLGIYRHTTIQTEHTIRVWRSS